MQLFSSFNPHSCHSFAHPAIFQEIFTERLQLFEQHIVGLPDQTNSHIGNGFGRANFHQRHIKSRIVVLSSKLAHFHQFHRIVFPLAVVSRAQVVLIINQKFLQTGFGNIHQLNFHLLRGRRSRTSFNNILFARTCCLHHLVDGAVATLQINFAKIVGNVVYCFCFLVSQQFPVIPGSR